MSILSPDEFEMFINGRITPEIKNKMLNTFNNTHLLMAHVRELDVVNNDYFFLAEGYIYNKQYDEPVNSSYVMGFSRDRRDQFVPIILSHIILLVLAIGTYLIMIKFNPIYGKVTILSLFMIPVAGFAAGRILPWIIVPFLSSFAPDAETLAKVSFWWPMATGLLLFTGPPIIFRILSLRITQFIKSFSIRGKCAPVFIAVSLGISAYLTIPVFLFNQSEAVFILTPVVLAIVFLSYINTCLFIFFIIVGLAFI